MPGSEWSLQSEQVILPLSGQIARRKSTFEVTLVAKFRIRRSLERSQDFRP